MTEPKKNLAEHRGSVASFVTALQGAGKWHGSLGKLIGGPLVRYKITRGSRNVATKSKPLEVTAIVNAHRANPDNDNNKTHKLYKYPVIDLWEMKGGYMQQNSSHLKLEGTQ